MKRATERVRDLNTSTQFYLFILHAVHIINTQVGAHCQLPAFWLRNDITCLKRLRALLLGNAG